MFYNQCIDKTSRKIEFELKKNKILTVDDDAYLTLKIAKIKDNLTGGSMNVSNSKTLQSERKLHWLKLLKIRYEKKIFSLSSLCFPSVVRIRRFETVEIGKVDFDEFSLGYFSKTKKRHFFIDIFTPGGVIKMYIINH